MLRPRAPQTRPRADAAGGSNASAQEARGHAGWQAPGLGNVRKWTPRCGRRVGVAAHPGPPSDDPELRRQRKLHALGQMQLLPPDPRPAALRDHHTDADAVETLSDTLSATTVFASPRGDVPQPLSGAMAPMAPDEATPGFTPPPSPGKMPARRAPYPASETVRASMCLCCTQPRAT